MGEVGAGSHRVVRARAVVLAILLTDVAWSVGLPLALVDHTVSWLSLFVLVVLIAFAVVEARVLYAAVTPWRADRDALAAASRGWTLVGLTAVAWWPLHTISSRDQSPWAWLAAFAVGTTVVVWPRGWVFVAFGATALAVLGAAAFDGSLLDATVVLAAGTLAVGGLTAAMVWLLQLLVAAEGARAAEAHLAVAEERLRMARELHDVLGSRLTAIALKADVAGALVEQEPQRAVSETRQIRAVATGTLHEARRAVRGHAGADLADQLKGARTVLESAGIRARFEVDPAPLAPEVAGLFGAAVREGVTNLLRHSEAQECLVSVRRTAVDVELVIANDQPHTPVGPAGLGMTGLVERAASVGARVHTHATTASFELRVAAPVEARS